MEVITDKPIEHADKNFIVMGEVKDNLQEYACLLNVSTGEQYIEKIKYKIQRGKPARDTEIINDDKEWKALFKFITEKTTIFSPVKVKRLLGITRKQKNTFPYLYK